MDKEVVVQLIHTQIFIVVPMKWVRDLFHAKTLNYGLNSAQTFLVYYNKEKLNDKGDPNFAAEMHQVFDEEIEACYLCKIGKIFGKVFLLFM